MAETYAQKVRQAATTLGEFTVDDLAASLTVQTYKERESLRCVLRDLKKSKEIILLTPGFFGYQGKQGRLTKVAKMWRAMRIKKYFTRQDIARLSGASETHVRRYIIFLCDKGFIVHVSGQGCKGELYRLADPDNAAYEHPKLEK